ncbi:NAD(P)-binding protein [Ramaria rubella]|nr:NAD(P)-binding protein [Ramaria rubella]
MLDDVPAVFLKIFAVFGVFLGIPIVYRLLSFIWIYFIRPSSVDNYLTGPAPYALITGASDGIGKAVAKELSRRGFNLILHGRNEEKTRKVVEEIRAMRGDRDVRYFLADATKSNHNFDEMLEPFKDLNITIVLNNVGGSPVKPTRLDEWPEDDVLSIVRWNALFSLLLMRTILPQLRRSSGRTLVMNVGSFAGDISPPRLSVYAASKRFSEFLGRGLSVDERYFTRTGVEFMYLVVGQVATNAMRQPNSLVCPSTDTFARAVVNRIGCGRRRIAPYYFHAISHWFVEAASIDLGEWVVAQAMKALFTKDGVKYK